MFRKEVLVKSNVKLKSSDKKKFAATLLTKYKEIKEEPNFKNDEVYLLKVTTYDERRIEVYVVSNNPWIFIDQSKWYPSVYFLWKYPDILFTYVMHSAVLPKLQEGADLMLPGLIFEGEVSVKKLGKLEKGAPCAVRMIDNKYNAPVAVGKTNISSQDMFECGMRGKGVQILHVVGDFLWKMGTKEPIPFISLVEDIPPEALASSSLEPASCSDIVDIYHEADTTSQIEEDVAASEQTEEKTLTIPAPSPDDRFKEYFLRCVKEKLSVKDLPLLASTFFGSIFLPFMDECGDRVNVKDTTYKKFSVFLTSLQTDGVIGIEERQKGIQAISAIQFNHEAFIELKKKNISIVKSNDAVDKKSSNSEFKEMFSLTAAVLPLVRQYRPNAKKGDPIGASDFRAIVSDYVKSRQLQNGSIVKFDDLLSQCLNVGGTNSDKEMSWDNLFKHLFSKMQPCYEFRFSDGQSGVKKGKTPNIIISVAKRAANKKVTLINNLEPMGIEPGPFAKELQIAVAASATLNDVATSVGPQVQIQGDNVDIVIKFLTDKHNINKKMIKIV